MSAPIFHSPLSGGLKAAAALLLVLGLFLLGVLLTPLPAPAQALSAPAPVLAPLAPPTTAEKGTIAAFAALIPQISTLNLPLVSR